VPGRLRENPVLRVSELVSAAMRFAQLVTVGCLLFGAQADLFRNRQEDELEDEVEVGRSLDVEVKIPRGSPQSRYSDIKEKFVDPAARQTPPVIVIQNSHDGGRLSKYTLTWGITGDGLATVSISKEFIDHLLYLLVSVIVGLFGVQVVRRRNPAVPPPVPRRVPVFARNPAPENHNIRNVAGVNLNPFL